MGWRPIWENIIIRRLPAISLADRRFFSCEWRNIHTIQKGYVSDEVWGEFERLMLGFLQTKPAQEWWSNRNSPFSNDFLDHIEKLIRKDPEWVMRNVVGTSTKWIQSDQHITNTGWLGRPYGHPNRKRYVPSSVVISQLGEKKGVLINFVDYSMFIIYSTRPISREGVLERFRLTNTIKRISLDVFDEGVDSIKHFFVCLLPV